jgi:general secretion pathway protein G
MKVSLHRDYKPPRTYGGGRIGAFSLIEVLAVIVVIGILAAVLIPVLSGIRQRALDSQAANNIRQLASANLLYAMEHQLHFAPTYPDSGKSWMYTLMPYVYGREAASPNEVNLMRMDPHSIFNVPDSESADERKNSEVTIAVNRMIRVGQQWQYSVQAVPRPDSIILLGECELSNTDTMGAVDMVGNSGHIPGFRREEGSKALMAFCDGHVEAKSSEDLESRGKPQDSNLWTW